MTPTMYRIITYTPNELEPSKYPISLDAEEEMVFSREEVERVTWDNAHRLYRLSDTK